VVLNLNTKGIAAFWAMQHGKLIRIIDYIPNEVRPKQIKMTLLIQKYPHENITKQKFHSNEPNNSQN